MKISIGCDHIVTSVKNELADYLRQQGHTVIDEGTFDNERTHYPIYGRKVGMRVVNKEVDFGVTICGTGVGIINSASKVPGVRAVLARDITTAKMARQELNANVVGFGGRIIGMGLMQNIVDEFIATKYQPTAENKKLIGHVDAIKTDLNTVKDDAIFDPYIQKWNAGFYHD